MAYSAQDVINKLDWEGPEGIEWFNPEDAFDPEGSADLYNAVQEARLGWSQYNRAIDDIEQLAQERDNDA